MQMLSSLLPIWDAAQTWFGARGLPGPQTFTRQHTSQFPAQEAAIRAELQVGRGWGGGHACMHACARACVYVCAFVRSCVRAWVCGLHGIGFRVWAFLVLGGCMDVRASWHAAGAYAGRISDSWPLPLSAPLHPFHPTTLLRVLGF